MRNDTKRSGRRADNRLFDRAAPFWDSVMGRWGVAPVLESLELGAAPSGAVLDLAGGTGRVADRLEHSGRPLVVVDLSRPMARRARRKNHEALHARAEALPLRSGALARVLVLDALYHMDHREAVLAEIARVLMPGGLAVFFEPDPEHWFGGLVRTAERLARMGSLFATGGELCLWLERSGLEPELRRRRGHLVIRARKPSDRPQASSSRNADR